MCNKTIYKLFFIVFQFVKIKISNKRTDEIIIFIRNLNIEKKYMKEFTVQKLRNLSYINEALTHSSANQKINYENLEFLGDAVLRLIASDFIKINYPKMKVGERSQLRSQLVSDCLLYTSPSPRD